jgi:TolB-like protein
MKKKWLGIIPVIMLIMACTSQPKANSGGMTLDQAIAEAAVSIDERITAGTKIALLNFTSISDRFSSYVLDELTANIVDSRKLIVVDRAEMDLIRSELDLQYSGEISDDSMQALGQRLGAQSIVSGSLTEIGGGMYRIVIRVLNVETAAVAVQYRNNIADDRLVSTLLEGGRSEGTVTARGSRTSGAVQTAPATVIPALADGTYSFYPRIQATQGARNVAAYLDKIVVLRGYVTFYIFSIPQGEGGTTRIAGSKWETATLKDMDTSSYGRLIQAERKFTFYDMSSIAYELTFQNVNGKRLTLASPDNPPVEFYDIVLDQPDN